MNKSACKPPEEAGSSKAAALAERANGTAKDDSGKENGNYRDYIGVYIYIGVLLG